MNNNEVAENYSNGATKGKGSNMFIEDATIYSYGYHFPIATRINNNLYLFNTESYSSSTATHKSYVLRVLTHDTVIMLKDCDLTNIDIQIAIDKNAIIVLKDKLTRVRSNDRRISLESNIKALDDNINDLNGLKQ